MIYQERYNYHGKEHHKEICYKPARFIPVSKIRWERFIIAKNPIGSDTITYLIEEGAYTITVSVRRTMIINVIVEPVHRHHKQRYEYERSSENPEKVAVKLVTARSNLKTFSSHFLLTSIYLPLAHTCFS